MPFDIVNDGYGVLWTINRRKEGDDDNFLDAWQDVTIDPDNDEPLSNFHITLTGYYRDTDSVAVPNPDPELPDTTEEVTTVNEEPITDITVLSITCTNRDDEMFVPPDTDRLFTQTSIPIRVGIETTSYYEWGMVFDQSTVKYLPGLSVADAYTKGGDVEVGPVTGMLPNEPLDPEADPPVYPMDTFTSLRPDTRTSVTLIFTATISCKVSNIPITETVTWTQEVFQRAYDWGSEVSDAMNNRTYFANGYTSDKR